MLECWSNPNKTGCAEKELEGKLDRLLKVYCSHSGPNNTYNEVSSAAICILRYYVYQSHRHWEVIIYSYLHSVFYTLQDDYCNFLFNLPTISDNAIGALLLVISLLLLTVCLLLIVKILRSALEGKLSTSFWIDRSACYHILTNILIFEINGFVFWLTGSLANLLKKFINADIPYVPWLTGYVAILVGAIMTFLVQSSSVFTSTLTPLVGVGLISVSCSPMT